MPYAIAIGDTVISESCLKGKILQSLNLYMEFERLLDQLYRLLFKFRPNIMVIFIDFWTGVAHML